MNRDGGSHYLEKSLVFSNLLVGPYCSPFMQPIREDFLGEAVWVSFSKESSERSWVRKRGFMCVFPAPAWQVKAFFSEPHASLPQVQERFLADGNDRLKLLVLLCGEDDEKVQKAAAGALAMLTAAHQRLCLKMTQVVREGAGGGPGGL